MRIERQLALLSRSRGLVIVLVLTLLTGCRSRSGSIYAISRTALRRQAGDLNSVISSVRGHYASNVVAGVLATPGSTKWCTITRLSQVPFRSPPPSRSSLVASSTSSSIISNTVSSRIIRSRDACPHVLDDFENYCA